MAGATTGAGTGARAGAGTTGAAGAAGAAGVIGTAAAASLAFTAPVTPRVAGDVDDSWMTYREQAAAADDAGGGGGGGGAGGGGAGGGAGGGSTLCPELRSDADFHRWRSEYHARYGTYIAMHGALEANALEFSELIDARDAAASRGGPEAAALSQRVAEFRVVRHARYGGMSAVFEWMELGLSAIKRRVNDYAARPP